MNMNELMQMSKYTARYDSSTPAGYRLPLDVQRCHS